MKTSAAAFLCCMSSAAAAKTRATSTGFLASQDPDLVEQSLIERYPFYHDSSQLHAEVKRLESNCGGRMTVTTKKDGDVEMDVIRVRDPNAQPNNRMFIASGEHARELIGSESVLHMLKALCGEVDLGPDRNADAVLAKSEFAIVLNANPKGRKLVDGGNFCQRMNPNNVDLNRNWDVHWAAGAGTEAFSEPESRLVRDMMTEFGPTAYLSVHSGTYGLYMPWAYSPDAIADRGKAKMLQVLAKVDEKHCQCPFGAAGKEVGYPCPGASVDWAYDKLNASYSFAFEIFVDGDVSKLKERWLEIKRTQLLTTASSEGLSLLQEKSFSAMLSSSYLPDMRYADFFRTYPSDFVGPPVSLLQENSSRVEEVEEENNDWCFTFYNPHAKEVYDRSVKNWAETFIDTSMLISSDLASDPPATPPWNDLPSGAPL